MPHTLDLYGDKLARDLVVQSLRAEEGISFPYAVVELGMCSPGFLDNGGG